MMQQNAAGVWGVPRFPVLFLPQYWGLKPKNEPRKEVPWLI